MTSCASYMICTSPRSGSTLLCRMLAATAVAGAPASLFFRPSLQDWMTRLGVDPGTAATEPELVAVILRAAIRKGRSGTPIFGLRQQRLGFDFLLEKLATLYAAEASDRERIARAFGPTLFIHLARADKVAQAVSHLKAQQTGLWHVASDGSELERTAPHRAPDYDYGRIKDCVQTMTAYDRGWNRWFTQQGIEPVRICYDQLSESPIGTLRHLLDRLGLDRRAADRVEPELRKMADPVSRDWIARFRAEAALDGPRETACACSASG
ncbi:Stf0 family sulfotransferase [Geminicoccus roseus]|uniref:Stf0 family sulfotransferase n=1 Tax=Geminicoccus roseus TaxID=404900 RepID=UPI0004190F2F|nr:Stf0 family sulfotransferase [Geminicoccus roseus]